MELHFLGRSSQEGEVVEGGYYALELDDCVHRVQVAALQPPKEALCLLLDHGQMEKVAVKELRPLEPRFLALPFQVS